MRTSQNPAKAGRASAVSTPRVAPRPGPPLAGDTGTQCRHDAGGLLPSMPGGQPHGAVGIDYTSIDWMLSLTPRERLEVLRQAVASLEKVRRAARLRPVRTP